MFTKAARTAGPPRTRPRRASIARSAPLGAAAPLPRGGPEPHDARSAALCRLRELDVGASLKWATAKVERASQRGNGDRAQGRERQAERGGDFNDQPPL
jgi:hypothetical protein